LQVVVEEDRMAEAEVLEVLELLLLLVYLDQQHILL
jgi:hypothetical protein